MRRSALIAGSLTAAALAGGGSAAEAGAPPTLGRSLSASQEGYGQATQILARGIDCDQARQTVAGSPSIRICMARTAFATMACTAAPRDSSRG